MIAVLVVDLGLALIGAGLLTGRLAIVGAGLVVLAAGLLLPAKPMRLPGPGMEGLDRWVPAFQFGEHHDILIQASSAAVYEAVRAVTAREIRFFRLLTWIRAPRLGRAPENILNPAPDRPILEVAARSQFVVLSEDLTGEVVFGAILGDGGRPKPATPEEFRAREGSFVRAVMNFHLSPEGSGTKLVTQTRIAATDAAAARRFAVYWRLIYPGSAFLRRQWLAAIRKRAEAAPPGPPR